MAAKGYLDTFELVKKNIIKIFSKQNPINVIKKDLPLWYRALFGPSVESGIVEEKHLAGYRNDRVFIRNSLHTPPPKEAVLDCMDAFF